MKNTLLLFIPIFLLGLTSLGKGGSDIKKNNEIAHTEDVSLNKLKVLSWNIYMLPPLILITGKQKRARIIGDILSASDYDVLVFQEAFHPTARRILKEKLSGRFPYQVGPINPAKGIHTSSGVWIISKYPLQQIGSVEYTEKEGLDNKMARKGAGMVEVNVNGQLVHIIGTHLNAGGRIGVRHSQVKQIRIELIDPFSRQDIPLIVCGDMNIECAHPAYYDNMVNILGAEDCIPGGLPRCVTANHSDNDFSGISTPEVIDYFFFRLPVGFYTQCDVPVIQKKWSSKHKSLSDHEPVSLELTWD